MTLLLSMQNRPYDDRSLVHPRKFREKPVRNDTQISVKINLEKHVEVLSALSHPYYASSFTDARTVPTR
jgi:hypothetical protein